MTSSPGRRPDRGRGADGRPGYIPDMAAARSDVIDLGRLQLARGEGKRLRLGVAPGDFDLSGEPFSLDPAQPEATLEVSHLASGGYALRLRFDASLSGRCMRCLEPALPTLEIDVREVDQPGGGEELQSPYVDAAGELDLQAWSRDAVLLALPAQVTCRPDCAGLCPICGEDLNINAHEHEREPDPRWAKLRELKLE
jgi:uncharacterized protein